MNKTWLSEVRGLTLCDELHWLLLISFLLSCLVRHTGATYLLSLLATHFPILDLHLMRAELQTLPPSRNHNKNASSSKGISTLVSGPSLLLP